MTTETDKMLTKIQALLNLAERAGTPEEAEVASAKAAELMAKYSITMAMLDSTRSKGEREKPGSRKISFEGVKYAKRKRALAYTIAKAHHCDGVATQGGRILHLFGFEADLDLVEMLYYSLLVQAERALAQTQVPWDMDARTFRTSWWVGYVNRIGIRLQEATRAAEAEVKQPGTDLVLADRSLAVQSALSTEYPSVRKTYSRTQVNTLAFGQGQAAGSRADLGRSSRVGSSRPSGALA